MAASSASDRETHAVSSATACALHPRLEKVLFFRLVLRAEVNAGSGGGGGGTVPALLLEARSASSQAAAGCACVVSFSVK